MRDMIGNAIVRLGMRIRRTRRYSGGTIPTPPPGSVRVQLSPGCYRVDPEVLRRYGRETFDRMNSVK